jgi:hypothetical protein
VILWAKKKDCIHITNSFMPNLFPIYQDFIKLLLNSHMISIRNNKSISNPSIFPFTSLEPLFEKRIKERFVNRSFFELIHDKAGIKVR